MLLNMSNLLSQIQTAKTSWDMGSPTLPTPNNLQNLGVSVADITRSFDEILLLIKSIDGLEVDGVLVTGSGLKPGIESIGASIAQHLTAYQSNTAQLNAIIPTICSWLHSLKIQLVQFVPAKKYTPKLEQDMSEKIAAVEQWAIRFEELKSEIEQSELLAEGSLAEISKRAELANNSVVAIEEILTKIETLERAAGTAKTNAESAAVSATTDSSEVKDFAKDLAESVTRKDELFSEFENRREEISGLLENANKVGLAKSFQDKRKELTSTWRFWAALFLLGIGTLIFIGNTQFFPLLEKQTIEPAALIVRLMLTGPVIWFTWFSARQYAHVLRVGEDYSFKEAAAMAYVGYRNEVDADPEMLKLLQEYAIKNFGNNPAELLLKKVDASTPLHDLIDKVLEKVKPEDVIKLLKFKE